MTSVAWFCLAVFGLELTVGVSWAVTLDIGGNYAGSVSAVMNTCGNIGGAIASFATGYIVTYAGWNPAFFVLAVLCFAARCCSCGSMRRSHCIRGEPAPCVTARFRLPI
jgi:MFS family permease